jgi:hypothetical protein
MKMIKLFVVSGVLGLLTTVYCAKAQDSTTTTTNNINSATTTDSTVTENDRRGDETLLYRPQELDLDLFGEGSIGQETLEHPSTDRFRHRGLYGGGGGLTAFFCRYVGVGGEYDAETRDGRFVDSASGNVYLRLPVLNTGLAPYIFGGGGYEFEDLRQSFGQAGAGLEYRFCHHVGLFADGRYVIANRTENFAQVRAGLRISF